MKIALLGYGKMGMEIERTALERGHEIMLKVNSKTKIQLQELEKADVAIDFSTPQAVVNNIIACFAVNLPVVVGTTGWDSNLNEISEQCRKRKQAMFHSSNFSIGATIFFELNKKLASLMDSEAGYEVSIEERHHHHKLDKPSGTAIRLADGIISNLKRKSSWTTNHPEKTGQAEAGNTSVLISSVREGDVPGTHLISYDSEIDTVEIKHTAKNRRGFALGAVRAAEYIIGKKGVFTMTDILNF